MLHEIMHLVNPDIIDQRTPGSNFDAYEAQNCLTLARTADSSLHLNADSYVMFAFAMKYDLFDWATGFSGGETSNAGEEEFQIR